MCRPIRQSAKQKRRRVSRIENRRMTAARCSRLVCLRRLTKDMLQTCSSPLDQRKGQAKESPERSPAGVPTAHWAPFEAKRVEHALGRESKLAVRWC